MIPSSLLRLAALAGATLVLAGCGEVRAADPQPPAAAAPAAAPPKDAAAKPAEESAAAAPKADGKPSPLRFEPTEKTRADFEVSFPTDI